MNLQSTKHRTLPAMGRQIITATKRIAPRSLVALLALACSTAAAAENVVYRCGEGERAQDIKIAGDEWFSRPSGTPDAAMEPIGCGSDRDDGAYRTQISCVFRGDDLRVTTRITPKGSAGFLTEQRLDTAALKLYLYGPSGSSSHQEIPCRIIGAPTVDAGRPATAAPVNADTMLSARIAAGMPFLIVTKQDALRLKRNGWYYPGGYWVMIEGRYHRDNGLWATSGVGFYPRGNPLHSCPAEFRCGGVHEEGFKLTRWHRPEDRELVAFGQFFTFDETGNLFFEGKKVGLLVTPAF